MRLSPDDLQSRFLGSVVDDFIVAHSDALFAPGVIVLGCFIRGALCAVARCTNRLLSESPRSRSELNRPTNCGLRTEILRRLVVMGRNRGIKTLQCEAEIIQPRTAGHCSTRRLPLPEMLRARAFSDPLDSTRIPDFSRIGAACESPRREIWE